MKTLKTVCDPLYVSGIIEIIKVNLKKDFDIEVVESRGNQETGELEFDIEDVLTDKLITLIESNMHRLPSSIKGSGSSGSSGSSTDTENVKRGRGRPRTVSSGGGVSSGNGVIKKNSKRFKVTDPNAYAVARYYYNPARQSLWQAMNECFSKSSYQGVKNYGMEWMSEDFNEDEGYFEFKVAKLVGRPIYDCFIRIKSFGAGAWSKKQNLNTFDLKHDGHLWGDDYRCFVDIYYEDGRVERVIEYGKL